MRSVNSIRYPPPHRPPTPAAIQPQWMPPIMAAPMPAISSAPEKWGSISVSPATTHSRIKWGRKPSRKERIFSRFLEMDSAK